MDYNNHKDVNHKDVNHKDFNNNALNLKDVNYNDAQQNAANYNDLSNKDVNFNDASHKGANYSDFSPKDASYNEFNPKSVNLNDFNQNNSNNFAASVLGPTQHLANKFILFDLSTVQTSTDPLITNIGTAVQNMLTAINPTHVQAINFDVCYSMLSPQLTAGGAQGSGSTALHVLTHTIETNLLSTIPNFAGLGSTVSYSYESSFYPLFNSYASYGSPATVDGSEYRNNFFPNSVVVSVLYDTAVTVT
jgi:hypothetical protein